MSIKGTISHNNLLSKKAKNLIRGSTLQIDHLLKGKKVKPSDEEVQQTQQAIESLQRTQNHSSVTVTSGDKNKPLIPTEKSVLERSTNPYDVIIEHSRTTSINRVTNLVSTRLKYGCVDGGR